MSKKIQTLAPARMTIAQAGVRLGLDPGTIRRLIRQGHIKRMPMPEGIKANLLASSVDELAARMYGDNRVAG